MTYFTATVALSNIQAHEQLSSQLLETYLARLEQREPAVQAWASLVVTPARNQASLQDQLLNHPSLDDLLREHPLLGIPVGIKDIFATVDMPTAWGFPLYAGRYLSQEAAVVSRLRAAGAIVLGKTVTTELATAAAGPTCNPHNLNYSPGGSSSGSAAAVADGMVPIAIGSQTMGSILRPAAYCGIFGFKPSFGLISRAGMMSVSDVLDQVGFFASCLEDIRLVFDVLLDRKNPLKPLGDVSLPPSNRPPQLAWIKTPDWHQVEPVAQMRLQQVVEVLSEAGAAIYPVELPTSCVDYWETVQTLCAYGLYQHHGGLLKHHPSLCSSSLRDWMQRGRSIAPSDYAEALRRQKQYRVSIDTLLQRFDAIVTPVTSGPAPLGRENTGSPRFCSLWTACGLPALNLPVGKNLDGLPVGCQLVGRYNQDHQLLQLAQRYWWAIQASFGGIQLPGQ